MRSPCAVAGLVLVALTPFGASAQRVDTTFVEVHGHRVALYVAGDAGPTVVMEAGGGSWHRDWVDVMPAVSRSARVVTYDRPGYGLSAACNAPRTADRVSRELEEALRQVSLTGPYVVVGWSLGGAFARTFAGTYPTLVRGLVLVDPAVSEFYQQISAEFPDEWSREVMSHFPAVYSDTTRRVEQQELAAFESSMAQARAADDRHRTLTVVLVAGRDEEVSTDPISRVWVRELTRWASRRPNTTTTIVPRSGHHIPRQFPSAVIAAIEDVIRRSRP
jgi:pimeloyl-ACP methyl ester carboxylesterase